MLQIYFWLRWGANKYTRFEKIWSLLVVLVNNYHGFVCQRLWRAFWLLKVQNFPFYNCGGCLRLRAIFFEKFLLFWRKNRHAMRMGAVGLVARGWGVWCGEGRFCGGGFCGIFGGGRRGQMRMAWRARGGYTEGIEASNDFVVRS